MLICLKLINNSVYSFITNTSCRPCYHWQHIFFFLYAQTFSITSDITDNIRASLSYVKISYHRWYRWQHFFCIQNIFFNTGAITDNIYFISPIKISYRQWYQWQHFSRDENGNMLLARKMLMHHDSSLHHLQRHNRCYTMSSNPSHGDKTRVHLSRHRKSVEKNEIEMKLLFYCLPCVLIRQYGDRISVSVSGKRRRLKNNF